MSRSIPLHPILAAVLVALPAALPGQDHASCPMHAEHGKSEAAPHPAADSHPADVDRRGDVEMGFDHTKTTHHFRVSPEGGAIEVTANSADDGESRDAIRVHLRAIAKAFAAGRFDTPMKVHDQVPPGVAALQAKKGEIRWIYEELPAGARVVAVTKDAEARKAVHEFLDFQIEEHRTGDPKS